MNPASAAVMARRNAERRGVDDYPTPPWAVRALVEVMQERLGVPPAPRIWEPACGRGHMVRALLETYPAVQGSDLVSYGANRLHDFIGIVPAPFEADWIITNPPFTLAVDFALRALEGGRKAALLLRTAFAEGGDRYRRLFAVSPPSEVLIFSERVSMVPGRVARDAAGATSHSWFVWGGADPSPTALHWIPPGTRARLERDADYE